MWYKAVFNILKHGAMVLGETEQGGDFRILELNEAALRIEGVGERGQLLGALATEALPFAGSSGLMKAFHRVHLSGDAESLIITVFRDKDTPSYRDCYLHRLVTGEVVMLYEDITEKTMREKEQKELQVQLYNSQKLESIGLLAGGVAHNFRNILQAVYGNAEYLEMLFGDQPEIKKIAGSIAKSAEKGADLIQDLLHFSRRSQDADFNGRVDLNAVIEKTCNIMSRLVDQKITLETRLAPGMNVKGDVSLLSQVFMNLITNARDAISGEGRILVDAAVENHHLVCRVSDTGTGMAPDTLKRVFDPFFSLKEVGKGTGLGLSTSRGIIEQHGGSITAASILGEGSTFEILLPFDDVGEVADTRPTPFHVPGNNEKILIVDDDESVLECMAMLVESLGYQPIKENRATEALKSYSTWSPDLVLIDRNMPEMDGLACTQEMIRLDPDARVVVISGYDDVGPDGIDEDVRRVIRGYLTKPCQIQDLAETISQVLAA